tara:strand:+ start:651 stop:854 length:204 start_codon:yes stop_codon:yes gene_type:complete
MMENYTLTLTTNCGKELKSSMRCGNVVHARNAAVRKCKALLGGETFGATFVLRNECGDLVRTETHYA